VEQVVVAAQLAPRLPGDLAASVLAQVAARMPRHDPSVHDRVARAIVSEAAGAGLDPLLVLALIHVESSFDPLAVSSAGAVGLMQLLEPTMRRELERSRLPAADPRDPVANVQAGVRYLRRLLDAFRDVDVALMAYNAGPNRIRAHRRSGAIPERFHEYPQRVKRELSRLRLALGAVASPVVARADGRARPGS
jgi:soluble lytic murein transglycosylase-like protein